MYASEVVIVYFTLPQAITARIIDFTHPSSLDRISKRSQIEPYHSCYTKSSRLFIRLHFLVVLIKTLFWGDLLIVLTLIVV